MTQVEQLALASSKVEHWRGKVERAAGILHKWEGQLQKLQSKGAKPVEPTAKKLPPLVLVPDTEHLAREAAMRDIAKAADEAGGNKVMRIKKASPKGKPSPKKK